MKQVESDFRLERLIASGDYEDWRQVVECGRDLIAEVRTLRAELEAANASCVKALEHAGRADAELEAAKGIIANVYEMGDQAVQQCNDALDRAERAEAASKELRRELETFQWMEGKMEAAIARAEKAETEVAALRAVHSDPDITRLRSNHDAAMARAEHAEGLVEKLVAKCDLLARVVDAARSVDSVEDAHSFIVLSLALQELDGVRSGEAKVKGDGT